jgi:anti-anti-sigma factor
MSIKIEKENFSVEAGLTESGRVAIELSGRFDHQHAPLLSQAIDQLADQEGTKADDFLDFVIYLSALEFMNSSAIRELISLLRKTQAKNGQLILIGEDDNPAIESLRQTGIDSLFTIFANLIEVTKPQSKKK